MESEVENKTEKKYTKGELVQILQENNCPQHVINHSIAVCDKAEELSQNFPVNKYFITAGALLHDIGRSSTHGIEHGVIGAKIARNKGFPEEICKIIERHIGTGITKEDAKKLGLEAKNYIPQTLEEKIVCHADNLISGTEEVSTDYTQSKWSKRMGDKHRSINEIVEMHEDLKPRKKWIHDL